MTLPNFVVLGPPRTATTWLFTCLTSNPHIGLSSLKELRFFDENFDKGRQWYEQQFADIDDKCTAIGDITPGYFSHPDVPDRMLDVLGRDIDLFVIQRDPVERAFSEYRGMLRREETEEPFEGALRKHSRLVANSSYAAQVQRYRERFDENRIHVLQFSEISADPASVISQVCRILDVPMVSSGSLDSRINEGTAPPRFRRLRRTISQMRGSVEKTKLGRKALWTLRRMGISTRFHHATSVSNSSEQDFAKVDVEACTAMFSDDQRKWKQLKLALAETKANSIKTNQTQS